MIGFPADIVLSADDWPQECGVPRPGDLGKIMPQGIGMDAPLIVSPWGSIRQAYYGFQQPSAHPFHNAPLTAAQGGTLYFDADATREQLVSALALAGVRDGSDYAAYVASSGNPQSDCYLDQMRLVSFMALDLKFKADRSGARPKQKLTISEAAWAFMQAQRSKWNHNALAGAAGGDGDNYEQLAFGFHVENSYSRVYRIWSRPFLVTK
jgi:hypothetical protein